MTLEAAKIAIMSHLTVHDLTIYKPEYIDFEAWLEAAAEVAAWIQAHKEEA